MSTDKRFHQFLIIIFIFLLFQLPFLDSVRRINVDESCYSNVAYNFSIGNGFVNTNIGATGGDVNFFYPLISGFLFYFFGASLYAARFASIIAGLISISGILVIFHYLKIRNVISYISIFLFIFSYNYFLIFRVARPEAWVLASLIWIIYFFIKYLYEEKNILIFFAGFITGISILSHPWGISFVIIFGIYFILMSYKQKKIKPILFYITGIIPSIVLLLLNISFFNGFSFNEIAVRFNDRSVLSNDLSNVHSEIKHTLTVLFRRYGLTGGRLYILAFHIIINVIGFTYYKKNKLIFKLSALQLALFFVAIIFLNYAGIEHILHFVFLFTFINFALIMNENYMKSKIRIIMLILSVIFIVNNAAGIYAIEKREYNNSYADVVKNIQLFIPESSVVLAPIEMWFPCKDCEFYNTNTSWQHSKYKNLKELLNSNNLEYIIFADGVESLQTKEDSLDVSRYITEKGTNINSYFTKNYGTISIWKINRNAEITR